MENASGTSEDPVLRRKRLRFRSWHRGMRELDLLLGSFADANLAGLSEAQLDRYEALLEVPEPQMYAWLTRQGTVPPEWDHDVMRLLLAFQYSPAVR